jgi:RNA polymerase-binding transcription factor DksA
MGSFSAFIEKQESVKIAQREFNAEFTMSDNSKASHKACSLCGRPIAPARLEALPGVTTCIECARKNPRKVDTRGIELSQASPINRNGFAPSD